MFNRFRDSLVYPARILNYRKDSFFAVFGYIMIFAILMSAGLSIYVYRFEELPQTFNSVFSDSVIDVEVGCDVVDSNLTCEKNAITEFYSDGTIHAYTDSSDSIDFSNYNAGGIKIIFHKDELYLSVIGINQAYKLNTLPSEFQNVDFDLIQSDKDAFTDQFINGLDEYLVQTKAQWVPLMIIFEFISNLFFILLIVLINSWILKTRFKIIPFREVFTMSVYSSTTLYVLLTINGLIALGYFFILLFVLVTFRQTNGLSMAIYKVIKKK